MTAALSCGNEKDGRRMDTLLLTASLDTNSDCTVYTDSIFPGPFAGPSEIYHTEEASMPVKYPKILDTFNQP